MGSRQERYERFEEIGRGGFALVFRARDRRLGREVALKELRPEVVADGVARRRLVLEARAAASLAHPGIVALYDVVVSGASVALVMELVRGGTLAERLRLGPLTAGEVLRIGGEVATALAHAHARGIVHRDLKPSNVLLTPEGAAKVTDFGLARVLPDAPALWTVSEAGFTPTDTFLGTTAYVSPEQARGHPVDARADVFSLGVLLFEAATGSRPFTGATAYEVVAAILTAEPDWGAPALGALPGPLVAVLRRALEKDPARRYRSMEILAGDLAACGRERVAPATPAVAALEIVGREAELARLGVALAQVAAPGGGGRTVLVSGETGIGKTTLVDEFLRVAVPGARLPVGRAVFREGRHGFRPIAEALEAVARAGELVPRDLQAWSGAGAAEEGSRRPFPEVVEEVTAALAGAGPFLLVLEDLQQAGADALAVLRSVIAALGPTHGLCLLTYRAEDKLGSGRDGLLGFVLWARSEGRAEEIVLPRFRAGETAAMVARILEGGKDPDRRLVEYVQAETEGVPLFVGHTVRYLIESGQIDPTSGVPQGELLPAMPARTKDVLAQRLEDLGAAERRVLEAAAIEGDVFHSEVVAAVLGVDRGTVLAALEGLVREHALVVPTGLEYRFSHTKVREILLEGVLPEVRAERHGRIADVLGRSGRPQAALLARHLVAAGRWEEALPLLVAAGRVAAAEGATDEALSLYRTAAGALEERDEAWPGRFDVLLELGRLSRLAGRYEEACRALALVARHAPASDRRRAVAVHDLGWLDLRRGSLRRARERFGAARRGFLRAGDRIWAAACRDALGVTRRRAGDLAGARREALGALGERRRLGFAWGVALSQSNLGVIESERGNVRRAVELFEASSRYFRRLFGRRADARQRLSVALSNLGVACLHLGRLERAMASNREALAVAVEVGDRHAEAMSMVNLAETHATLGLRAAAADGFEAAERLAARLGNRVVRSAALRELGCLRRSEGANSRSLELLEAALAEARASADAETEALAAIELGMTLARLGRSEPARGALQVAQAGVRRHGLRALQPAADLLAARLLALSGRARPAAAACRRALAALARRPDPELRRRVLEALAGLSEGLPGGKRDARRYREQARALVRRAAAAIREPALREAYLREPERLRLLGALPLPLSQAATQDGLPPGSLSGETRSFAPRRARAKAKARPAAGRRGKQRRRR